MADASNVQTEAVKVSVVHMHVGVLGHSTYMSMHVVTSRVLIYSRIVSKCYLSSI